MESGLPFVQVSCMYQDEQGYLWSGGYGGLGRFDGKQFVNFNRKNGLIDHNVNAICGDDSGSIFIATNKGLSILRGNRFENIRKFQNLGNPYVTSLCKGYHHSMYLGTTKGLYMYGQKAIKPVKRLEGYKINCLYNPDTSVIFIGTDKGLVVFGHNSFNVFNAANGLASDKVNCLVRFRNYLVIGTADGLSLFDLQRNKFTNYYIQNGLIDENITACVNQDNKFLWIGSPSGLLSFDGTQFNYFNIGYDNNSNQIRSLCLDREDNIWTGTNNGLFRYRDNSFSTFDKVIGLGNSFIFQIFRDKNNDLWVCSQNNGIYRETQNYFKRYGVKNGLHSSTSRAGLQDKSGRLLFATEDEVTQFKNERFVPIPLPREARGPYDVMYEAHDGVVWIGGTNGIVSLQWRNAVPVTNFYPISSKNEFAVYGFCEDDAHTLYVGTHKAGLLTFKNGVLKDLSAELKLNEETFFTLKYYKNTIFAASLNGLLLLDVNSGKLRRISDADGLNSELVYSIEFTDGNANLWIGTNQGINRLDIKKYFNTGQVDITSYGKQEGFAGVECNSNGIWEDKDGTLWFGTVSGLIKHQPFNFKRNTVENKTLIQKIRLMNEDTVLSDNCVLPYNMNTIAFYYRGICLTNPDRVLYQKKLEGLEQDQEWSIPGTEDYIKYTNLSPGRYTFKVRSSNNEGLWNSKETSFTFFIQTPFYLTWWFILLCMLLVFIIFYIVFTLRIRNIKRKQKEEFERKVEMSKVELKALRSQMNPHFVFNSLNAIQHYIFNTKSDEAIKYLNKFARLVRIILNNSEKPSVTVGEDLEALKLYLQLEQMRFEEKFDYEITMDESVDPDYDIMPPLLMQPYVENAILHGLNPMSTKGKLSIHLSSKNNFLICTITDNGIGREKASEIRRTMPFNKHKSMGMKITEDRLKILNEINNSQLSVNITDLKDEQGNALGTKVELFVPWSG
mgnify:CR=1 FL=1